VDKYQGATWRKSHRSGGNDNCVEIAVAPGGQAIGIRDSKAGPDGPVLDLDLAAWGAFLADIRDGAYDGPG
jgi:hypothetical protein